MKKTGDLVWGGKGKTYFALSADQFNSLTAFSVDEHLDDDIVCPCSYCQALRSTFPLISGAEEWK